MAVWSQAQYQEVIARGRIDSEYHSHDGRHVENRLVRSAIKLFRLKDCCEHITSGHTPLRHDLTCGKVFFITVECVSPLQIDYDLSKRVRTVHYSGELNRVALTKECVVVTIKRRIAQASPCYNLKGNTVVNQDVAVLRLKNGWNPGYIAAYLISKFGQKLADRERTEQMNPYLPVNKLGNLLIPEINIEFQRSIDELIKKRFECLAEAEKAYFDAQHLLESELGLDKLSFKKPMGYTAQFSDIEASRRLDPEHFYPAFQHLAANLPRRIKLVLLGTQISFCQRGKQPVYSGHGLPVINSKHVQPNKIICEDSRTAIAGALDELRIRYGDTLINGTGRGTIGRTAPYLLDHPSLPDNHVTILRSTTLDPAYLSFYLNSLAGQLQVEMHQRGTSGQLELYPFDIRKFFVWVAPESFQKEIRALYDQAAIKEKQSKELLSQAKTRVEQLIEEAASDASRKGIKERMR